VTFKGHAVMTDVAAGESATDLREMTERVVRA